MINQILSIPFRIVSGKPGYPIHSTEGMPEDLINFCAPIGICFMLLVFYSHFKSRLKKKIRKGETYARYLDRQKRLQKKP